MGAFNDNLKHYRGIKGLSGREFSELLEIGYSTYMNYENRKVQPPFEILCKMADILGVTTDILLGRTVKDDYSIPKQAGYMDKSFEKEEKELLLDIQKFYWGYLQEYMAREDADMSTVNIGIGLLRGLIYISTKFHSDRSVGPSIIPSSLSQGM